MSGREKAVAGKLDALYYALGDDDAFVVVDLPSWVRVASLCIAVTASRMVSTRTVPLVTVAEMDKALARARTTGRPAAKPQMLCPAA